MALCASCCRCWESGSNVIRDTSTKRWRAVPGRLVAAHTVSRVQRVVVVDVARGAGRRRRRNVCSCQRKARHAVVERSGVPALSGVASDAICDRKRGTGSRVGGVIRLLPGCQVALRVAAIRWRNRQIVVVVDMARSAGHIRMAIRQQESRRAVIEDGRGPGNRVVASRAVAYRKCSARRRVHRIVRLLPGCQVASRVAAICWRDRQIVVVVDVAGRTWHIRMAIRQQESRRAVIELCAQPTVKGVARIAGGRKLRAHMVRIGGLLIIGQMTRGTGCREALELANSSALVAILALDRGVSPQEWETILVILYLLDSNIPPEYGVALRAIRAHFALVNVRVTILALLADISEDRLDVALRAFHFFVHASQRILGFVVVELGDSTNGPPSGGRVTVLTRYLEGAMRASSGLPLRFRPCSGSRLPEKKGQPEHDLDKRGIDSHPEPSIFPLAGGGGYLKPVTIFGHLASRKLLYGRPV